MGFYFANKNKCIFLFAGLFMTAMVLFPQVTELGTKSAILIWANAIVPVLLPFYIFADFMKRMGYLEKLPPGIYAFFTAFLSGYPMGAKVTGDLVSGKVISAEQGKVVLSYAMVTGPGFLFGAVGEFLGSTLAAGVVCAAHYGGAMLNGLLWSMGNRPAKSLFPAEHRAEREVFHPQGTLESFTLSILAGFRAMALILAYLMFFLIGIQFLEETGILFWTESEMLRGILKGVLEMTAGVNAIGLCSTSMQKKIVISSVLVSFGGLSVLGQSASMAAGSGIRASEILTRKATHGMLAGILAVILVRVVI